MKVIGAHSILYSKDAEADRAFLRDVLQFPHVDVGHGWLIFGLPPSEIAIHPGEEGEAQEFYFMVDDVKAFIVAMEQKGANLHARLRTALGQPHHALPAFGRAGWRLPAKASAACQSMKRTGAMIRTGP